MSVICILYSNTVTLAKWQLWDVGRFLLKITSAIWQVCTCVGVCAHWVNVVTFLFVGAIYDCLLVCFPCVLTLRSLEACHGMSLGCCPTLPPPLVSEDHKVCPFNFWVWPHDTIHYHHPLETQQHRGAPVLSVGGTMMHRPDELQSSGFVFMICCLNNQ